MSHPATQILRRGDQLAQRLEGLVVAVVKGPDKGRKLEAAGDGAVDEVIVGTAPTAGLQLTDSTVSRHHASIRVLPAGYLVTDLESTNGVLFGGRRLFSGVLQSGDTVDLGATRIKLTASKGAIDVALSGRDRFGNLLGESVAARRLFALLERVAPTESTVLVTGETGTGKDLVAEALHDASPRRARPFVVFDCGACAQSLIEAELFGHERGAFTGADQARPGVFERAHGGTLFLDEIGELPKALQPKLLRALESRTVRRLGGTKTIDIDVRVIAATHRDLKREVNRGGFREDLFYRLHVISIEVPPLRERMEDVPLLATAFWRELRRDPLAEPPHELIESLLLRRWPGNVRELRNRVERAAVIGGVSSTNTRPQQATYKEAKAEAVDEFERRYLAALLKRAGGNVSEAARLAEMNRVHLTKLIQQYDIERPKRG